MALGAQSSASYAGAGTARVKSGRTAVRRIAILIGFGMALLVIHQTLTSHFVASLRPQEPALGFPAPAFERGAPDTQPLPRGVRVPAANVRAPPAPANSNRATADFRRAPAIAASPSAGTMNFRHHSHMRAVQRHYR